MCGRGCECVGEGLSVWRRVYECGRGCESVGEGV